MIDLTVPGGGISSITGCVTFVDGRVDVSEAGVMKRMLLEIGNMSKSVIKSGRSVNVLVIQVIVEFRVEAFDILQGGDYLKHYNEQFRTGA